MSEKEFYDLLLDMIRRGQYPKKVDLLDLLKRSKLICEKTNIFTRQKWNHYQEYIYIVTNPSDMSHLLAHQKYLETMIEKIYPVGDDYEYELSGVEIKPGKITEDETVSQEIHFEDIQTQIIEEIRSAKYTIWVAMAWFTNVDIFNELVKKKKQGVNVQVVIDDNQKNSSAPFRLEDHFETYRISITSRYNNIMHDKFCIIDLHKVVHGTFNWTNAANYNKETISVDDNTATAREFADEFIKLKQVCTVNS